MGARWNYEPIAHEGLADASSKRGGVSKVLSALPVLAEQADPWGLLDAARDAPLTWSARLGVLLGWAGYARVGNVLAPLVREFLTVEAALAPHVSSDGARLDETWCVRMNVPLPAKRR